MTKLLLVRHGHVEGISPERFRGRAELPLTALGRREAALTAAHIAACWRPAAIYTSPMGRCVDTGAAIGKPLGLAASAILRLNDIDYGDWQGLTPDEVRARWPGELDAWYRHPDWAAIPSGESLQQVLTRAVAAFRDIVKRHPDDTVVLVSHDSVNRVLLMQLMGMPLRFYRALAQDPCCINVIEQPGPAAQVRLVNSTEHLRDL
jgi:probable phosphoglycerate mutase